MPSNINWGSLQPVPMPSVGGSVGSSSSSSPPAPNQTLAGGFLSGLAQGTDLSNSIDANNRAEAQNKRLEALAPSELAKSQNEATTSGVQARAAVQAEQDAATIREKAKVSEQAVFDAYDAQGKPEKKYEILKAKEDLKKVTADIANVNAETAIKGPAAQAGVAISLMQASEEAERSFQAAEKVKPGAGLASGQRTWDIMLSQLPENTREHLKPKKTGDTDFTQFNRDTYVSFHGIGMEAYAKQKEADEKKNLPDKVKTSKEIARLQNLPNPTPEETSTLKNLTAQADQETSMGRALNKSDATAANVQADTRQTMASFKDTLADTRKQLEKVPDALLGPVASLTKLAKLNPDVQVLSSLQNALTLQAKSIYGLNGGTQGFTDAEREFLSEVTGNLAKSKQPLRNIMDGLEKLSAKVEHRAWKRESGIRKRDKASYDSWLEANPEPKLTSTSAPRANEASTASTITPEMARAELARRQGK